MAAGMIRQVFFLFACAVVFQCGCACPRAAGKQFDLSRDSFSFTNELRWVYEFPKSGQVLTHKVEPAPEYFFRCFPLVRSAREFFYHAEFRPDLPKAGPDEYRDLVRAVIHRNSRYPAEPNERIVIPGFQDLHEFSAEYRELLKSQCGGPLQSFFQRGNWRIMFPSTEGGRTKTDRNKCSGRPGR